MFIVGKLHISPKCSSGGRAHLLFDPPRCPKNKTTGRDEITTEQWQMAVISYERGCRRCDGLGDELQVRAHKADDDASDAQPKEAPAHALSATTHSHARAATCNAESDALDVTLLPKMANLHMFKALRPITIVPAHLKVQSKVVFDQLQGHDGAHTAHGIPDPAMMGFRRGLQCVEVVSA